MPRLPSVLILTALLVMAPPVHAAQAGAASPAPRTPSLTVHRSPTCGCCLKWVEHLRQAGLQVEIQESEDLQPLKQRLGVPESKRSCHTAQVGGYFIEGHVPAADIKRLLAERPDARGLTVPGMPLGSPGMETPDGTQQPYAVELIERDGKARVYSSHGK